MSISQKEQLAAIAQKSDDIDAALELLNSRISIESNKTSRVIVEKVTPTYQRLVNAICKHLVRVHEANKAYHELLETLDADEVFRAGLYPMQPVYMVGDPRDSYSTLAVYLRDAVANGFLPASELPQEFVL